MLIADEIITELKRQGYDACVTPVERLKALEAEYKIITSRDVWRNSPHLSQHHFDFSPPPDFPARSVITVAAAVTPVKLGFTYKGRRHSFEAPPLSGDYENDIERIIAAILSVISPHGYRLADANIPTKVLASHAGLLVNGINNMGYIPGMGSFFRLAAFYSDAPPNESVWWDKHRVSDLCRDCGLCLDACPTNCISHEVYDVGRCLSLLSKEPSDFPDWVNWRWHNSLIGCRVCQQVCPMNRIIFDDVSTGAEFSEIETEALLSGVPFDALDPATKQKLRYFHLAPFYSILPRNLSLLLNKVQGAT